MKEYDYRKFTSDDEAVEYLEEGLIGGYRSLIVVLYRLCRKSELSILESIEYSLKKIKSVTEDFQTKSQLIQTSVLCENCQKNYTSLFFGSPLDQFLVPLCKNCSRKYNFRQLVKTYQQRLKERVAND